MASPGLPREIRRLIALIGRGKRAGGNGQGETDRGKRAGGNGQVSDNKPDPLTLERGINFWK
jgi:hypothetical protein